MAESIERPIMRWATIGDRQGRLGMIYVRGGRGKVGSPEVAPVEGDHE
jgi:hypothetical protein